MLQFCKSVGELVCSRFFVFEKNVLILFCGVAATSPTSSEESFLNEHKDNPWSWLIGIPALLVLALCCWWISCRCCIKKQDKEKEDSNDEDDDDVDEILEENDEKGPIEDKSE